jgi:hypothetical protein
MRHVHVGGNSRDPGAVDRDGDGDDGDDEVRARLGEIKSVAGSRPSAPPKNKKTKKKKKKKKCAAS